MAPTSGNESRWLRSLWFGVLIVASATLTAAFACVTPYAAFAVLGALALPRAGAVCVTVALWLTSQSMGYGILHYPWTAHSFAWGVAIGAAAVAGTLAAQVTLRWTRTFRSPIQAISAFVPAFVLYQLALYAVAASVLGGTGTFTPRIVGQVLVINVAALVGLYGLNHVAATVARVLARRRPRAVSAQIA